ncbi:hypothetical protein P9112_014396 [Eukaryota sp. TZLM1-RC]
MKGSIIFYERTRKLTFNQQTSVYSSSFLLYGARFSRGAETLVSSFVRDTQRKRAYNLSRETVGRNAERRPSLFGMDKRIKKIMAVPIKDTMDWKGSLLHQYRRIIRKPSIEQTNRTALEDILLSEMPA